MRKKFLKKLQKLVDKSKVIHIDDTSKIIFFSDCHRSYGDHADDFAHNQLIFITALTHYYNKGYTYIELGDGDELWENKDFNRIKEKYRTIFEIFDEFHINNRLYYIWGNHNRRWKNQKKVKKEFSNIYRIWEHIVNKNKILVPSIVLRWEVYFYEDEFDLKQSIDLLDEVGNTIAEVSTTADELRDFKNNFARFIKEDLDPGETEALKILNDRDNCSLCTCDKVAIKVISLLGKREQGLSFEKLLKSSGITKKLEKKHTEKYFRKYLDEGSQLRIQSFGFK